MDPDKFFCSLLYTFISIALLIEYIYSIISKGLYVRLVLVLTFICLTVSHFPLSSLPCQFLPMPSVAGFYFARFFTKKSLPSYFAFVVLGSLMVTWFIMHNFWDLNIWMAGMSLKSFCKVLVASVVIAFIVPGLALLPSNFHFLTEIGLTSHALMLCYIENRLFSYSSIYYYGFEDDVMYPSYAVILTTFVGLAMVRRLSADHRVGPKAVWILTCLYSSKLAMLVIASKSVVWMSAILLLAISPPLLLYKYRDDLFIKEIFVHYFLIISNLFNPKCSWQRQVQNRIKNETLARLCTCWCCCFISLVLP